MNILKYIQLCLILICFFLISQPCLSFSNRDKGEWLLVEEEMSSPRTFLSSCRLLPDGKVFIMGGYTDFAEIFDTQEQKIIKKIPIDSLKYEFYNSISLNNGNILIIGGERQKKSVYTKPVATMFNAKTHMFEEVSYPSDNFIYANLILLNNSHILMVSSTTGSKDITQIYNPNKNLYYTADNNNLIPSGDFLFKYKNGDILFHSILGQYIYKYADNKFEKYPYGFFPHEHISVQIDENNYLNIKPMKSYSEGYTYNIETKVKTPVKNKINRTWYVNNPFPPQTVLLDNGNVLILGIYAKGDSKFSRLFYKYSSYIYDKKNNKFYKIKNPTIPIYKGTGIIKLKDGNILFAGGPGKAGKKIQIYKYKN